MKTARRRAREFVVQGLYQAQLNSELTATNIRNNLLDNEQFFKADEPLFNQVFENAFETQTELLNLMLPHLDRALDEVSPIERAVLLMATYELREMPETPYPVIINEAIEITKTFGGTDGYKFVNGILDKLAPQLRPNDPPRK
ncbi:MULTISPECIES: transcription antitermination factor NusB [Vitreoscilla]|uniref:Transcription antitermination protein NusB n=1 Tax=Vitreoscilla stercoraria TaxID=61 RepID=A0ABY4E7J4_VITST|nr:MULTISPECIES: transcription antitermination factor NusB [Vitreoscilla]AUZ04920.1 transcription antitermination factor NusB [Vitreoscilla sp. C1]UOO91427.1 transcription antitermination factor NusB [Vitreoscilla stercoraria]